MDVSINGARILATFENVPLFGTVQITQTLAASWLVMIIISSLAIWLGLSLRVAFCRLQWGWTKGEPLLPGICVLTYLGRVRLSDLLPSHIKSRSI